MADRLPWPLQNVSTGCVICFGSLLKSLRLEKRPKTYAPPCNPATLRVFMIFESITGTKDAKNLFLLLPFGVDQKKRHQCIENGRSTLSLCQILHGHTQYSVNLYYTANTYVLKSTTCCRVYFLVVLQMQFLLQIITNLGLPYFDKSTTNIL